MRVVACLLSTSLPSLIMCLGAACGSDPATSDARGVDAPALLDAPSSDGAPDAGTQEIAVSPGVRDDVINTTRDLITIRTDGTLTVDEALAPIEKVSTVGFTLSAVAGLSVGFFFANPPAETWNGGNHGCFATTAGHVTLSSCPVPNGSLDGSVSYSQGHLEATLTFTALQFVTTYRANLELSVAHVTGTLHLTYDNQPAAGTAHYVQDMAMDVGYQSGCPTSGTISFSGSLQSSTSGTATAHFGPDCGAAIFFP